MILAAGAAAEFFFPDKIPFLHRSGEVGVPIGVPDASRFATRPTQSTNAPPPAANRPIQNASPAIAATNQASPPVAEQAQSSNASPGNSVTSPTQIWNQIASATRAPEPAPPALGPSGPPSSSAPEDSEQSSSTQSNESTVPSNKETIASNRTSTSRSERSTRALPDEGNYDDGGPIHPGGHHARVVGKTADGGLIVRLSSGRVVTLPPLNDNGVYRSRPRRHRVFPPSQPFYPND